MKKHTAKPRLVYLNFHWGLISLYTLLIGLCMTAAFGIIYLKHQSRALYAQLAILQEQADALHVEWSQLLLEKGAWASDARVERVAREELGMGMPPSNQIVVIRP